MLIEVIIHNFYIYGLLYTYTYRIKYQTPDYLRAKLRSNYPAVYGWQAYNIYYTNFVSSLCNRQ